MTQPLCQIFLAYLPLYQIAFPDHDLTSPDPILHDEMAEEAIRRIDMLITNQKSV